MITSYEGGCHCGAVRFRVDVEDHVAVECNCSICTKKAFLHHVVPKERFVLLRGAERLASYKFNTRTANHMFCRTCGIHSFYRPRSLPEGFDVNVRCLDGDAITKFTIKPFDGRNWERSMAELRAKEEAAAARLAAKASRGQKGKGKSKAAKAQKAKPPSRKAAPKRSKKKR